MSIERITIPDIGDFDAVDVVEVLVSPGDVVAVEDPLITLESDKATLDVPSPKAGKVIDVKVKAGDKVGEGATVLTLDTAAGAKPAAPEPAAVPTIPAAAPTARRPAPSSPPSPPPRPGPVRARLTAQPSLSGPMPYASPAVRRFARELGVDLTLVRGTGRSGRILKPDVQAYVKKTLSSPAGSSGGSPALPPMPVIEFSKFGSIEREPLTRIQRISLANLHRSWLHVAHVTQHDEADITEMEAFRKANSEDAKALGFKLTPVAFLMKAVVAALQKYPWLNSSLDPDGEHVILKRYYHLGIAVDTENGLTVPVIRDVDGKSLYELARELGEVSAKARDGKLTPKLVQGASFTITSLGGIGGTAFTPIVNAPEVAILGVSRAAMKPVWNGQEFDSRLMLPLSLSYDHRVVDGALAVRFTTYLCKILADIRRLLL